MIGAQAVYLHTGPADLAVAELTTDADLAISPQFLADEPDNIQVDLLVPEALAGRGRRSAELSAHTGKVARRALGIEGALVDNETPHHRGARATDDRSVDVAVAGPAALLAAKIHKIADRAGHPGRVRDKDALDVLRLLRAIPLDELTQRTRDLLASDLAGDVTRTALGYGNELLGQPEQPWAQMAARAVAGLEDPDIIAASLAALFSDLAYSKRRCSTFVAEPRIRRRDGR
ncbi:hypothetical protein BH23ACT10_BH23ACT10_17860 [soil metagenome]